MRRNAHSSWGFWVLVAILVVCFFLLWLVLG